MADWPSTLPAPSFGKNFRYYKPQIRTESEANYISTRARFTIGRRQWPDYGWDALTQAHLDTLRGFFETYQGSSFNFPDPEDGTVRTCVFMADMIDAIPFNRTGGELVYLVTCPIEEIPSVTNRFAGDTALATVKDSVTISIS